jgi:serine protease Do
MSRTRRYLTKRLFDCHSNRWQQTVALVLLLGLPAACLAQPLTESLLVPSNSRSAAYQQLSDDVDSLSKQLGIVRRAVRLARSTVVHLEAEKVSRTGRGSKPVHEAGAGIVIQVDNKFYVMTNRHVILGTPVNRIAIRAADGAKLTPTKVWADQATDIAVIAVAELGLIAARIGDSDQVEIGEFVLAVGSPFGLSQSVTYGIISAVGRRDLELGDRMLKYQDFLQTDAAINPGNSGGPLLNLKSEVIGINTAIASASGGSEGIGFTIPINMVIRVVERLLEHGHVPRAFLGVNLDENFSTFDAKRLGVGTGARVSGVIPNTPASVARLQVDDVIIAFDGARIRDDNHLINRVSLTPIGKTVNVLVFRRGSQITVTLKVADRNHFES